MNESAIFNNIIINVPLFEDFFIVGFVSVGELIRLSLHLSFVLGKLLSLFLGKFKAIDESSITDDIIIGIIDILNFLVISFISVGETIRLSLDLDFLLGHVLGFLLGEFEAIDESGVANDIIIGVIDILNFFIIGLISVGEFIGFSLYENNSLRCFYSLKRCDLRS